MPSKRSAFRYSTSIAIGSPSARRSRSICSTSVPSPSRSALADLGVRRHAAHVDQLRARDHPARPHLLGVAREAESLLDLGARDERALALHAVDALLGLEALQRVPHGRARDAELGAELALGRQGGALRQAPDHLDQRLAQQPVLRLAALLRVRPYTVDHVSLPERPIAFEPGQNTEMRRIDRTTCDLYDRRLDWAQPGY